MASLVITESRDNEKQRPLQRIPSALRPFCLHFMQAFCHSPCLLAWYQLTRVFFGAFWDILDRKHKALHNKRHQSFAAK